MGLSRLLQRLLMKFEGCLKKVSSVFQENFKHSFKDVSMMFNEKLVWNFVLHGPHHSYPGLFLYMHENKVKFILKLR